MGQMGDWRYEINKYCQKTRLDIIGKNNRERFLSACAKELKQAPSAVSVKKSCSSLFNGVLGSSPYIFVSVNLPRSNIRKALKRVQNKNGGVLPDNFIRYGQEFYQSIRSGRRSQEAAEKLWSKFLIRLNQKVLRSEFKRHGHSLKWVLVHENDTKLYSNKATNHLHMLIELPAPISQFAIASGNLKEHSENCSHT